MSPATCIFGEIPYLHMWTWYTCAHAYTKSRYLEFTTSLPYKPKEQEINYTISQVILLSRDLYRSGCKYLIILQLVLIKLHPAARASLQTVTLIWLVLIKTYLIVRQAGLCLCHGQNQILKSNLHSQD